jgi:hypothetical protein
MRGSIIVGVALAEWWIEEVTAEILAESVEVAFL